MSQGFQRNSINLIKTYTNNGKLSLLEAMNNKNNNNKYKTKILKCKGMISSKTM
jgi:hypothetical protein